MAVVLKPKRSETGGSQPTTSDLEVGEIAVNTTDQKIYMRTSSGIVTIADTATGSGSAGSAFTNIAVSGQSTVQADSSTDTLTLVAEGLNTITTDASTDTITFGTPTGIPFEDSSGTSHSLKMSVVAGTLTEAIAGLYMPFTDSSGTSHTTLIMS
jgi:hypothetical protein